MRNNRTSLESQTYNSRLDFIKQAYIRSMKGTFPREEGLTKGDNLYRHTVNMGIRLLHICYSPLLIPVLVATVRFDKEKGGYVFDP